MTETGTTISVAPTGASLPNALALSLGWRLAEVFHQQSYVLEARPAADAPLPAHLPGVGQMSAGETAIALLHIIDSIARLLNLPVDDDNNTRVITANIKGQVDPVVIKKGILRLYMGFRDQLASTIPDQATALGLGRMLADTTLLPSSADANSYIREFQPTRLQNAYDWLGELEQTLPAKSAKTVRQSLRSWAEWVSAPDFLARRQNREADKDLNFAFGVSTTRALRRQGDVWRRLLSGEQVPEQLLNPEDYVQAGARMLDRIRGMSFRFLRRWWVPCLSILLVFGAISFALVHFAPAGTSKSVAIVVSAFAALGVTWKGIGSTLGRVLSEAQTPLWDAEVLTALSIAATRLPPGSKAPVPNPGATVLPPSVTTPNELEGRTRPAEAA